MAYRKLNPAPAGDQGEERRPARAQHLGVLHQEEIRRLVALGEKYHVTIVPEINSPGHMDPWIQDRPDLPARRHRRQGPAVPPRHHRARRRSPTTRASSTSTPRCSPARWWHMGADSTCSAPTSPSTRTSWVRAPEYRAGRHPRTRSSTSSTRSRRTRRADRQLRIWNDGLTGANTVPVTPARPSSTGWT
ncbi:family 20 glycosylhydrolase [Streptomyces sp. KL116D]|uniref:family 20 glycosylhydrolase n=1 Tax=Streptomyces sp. KL116D TaxID=3045152 RepID=UPI003556A085